MPAACFGAVPSAHMRAESAEAGASGTGTSDDVLHADMAQMSATQPPM